MTEEKPKRPRGTGSVFQMKGSRFYWIKYYRSGKAFTESSGSEKEKVAETLLRTRIGEVAVGNWVSPADRRVTVDELYSALLDDYRNNGLASLEGARQRWDRNAKENEKPEPGRLQKFFGGRRAVNVTTDLLNKYVNECFKQGLANATINRDLSALRRAFNLAYKAGKIQKVPFFPHLKESAPRQGFLEDSTYAELTKHAPELWLRALLECLFTWGNRRSELLRLKVGQVDLAKRVVVLNAGETKNDDWRILPMTQAVHTLLSACVSGKSKGDFVFTDDSGNRRRKKGAPIKDFRGRWERLLSDARVNGKQLVHDFRRSAVRNMERAGVPRSQAMKISGHKTESVYRRYAIVSEADLLEAAKKLEAAKRVWVENGESLVQNTQPDVQPKAAISYN